MIRVIGYGNPGRGDDGLGQAFAARIDAVQPPGVIVSTDYQLTVDHGLLITDADQVVFVDALMRSETPFTFAPVAPDLRHDLTSHSLTPAAVLALSATLFGAQPEAYVLGISGHEFGEVKEGLSVSARSNLTDATAFFLDWLGKSGALQAAEEHAHA